MAANFTTAGADKYPAGHVLQVVTSAYTTEWTQSMTGSTYELVNNGSVDLSISITPTSTSNKVLLNLSFGRVVAHNSASGYGLGVIIQRNGTSVGIHTGSNEPKCSFSLSCDSINYDGSCMSHNYLDSPSSTSACVYKFLCISHTASNWTTQWNRQTYVGNTYPDEGYAAVTTINFIASEIAG